jgi:hypothetical protein
VRLKCSDYGLCYHWGSMSTRSDWALDGLEMCHPGNDNGRHEMGCSGNLVGV